MDTLRRSLLNQLTMQYLKKKVWIHINLLIVATVMLCGILACNNGPIQFQVNHEQFNFSFKYPYGWQQPRIDTSTNTELSVDGIIPAGINKAGAVFSIVVALKEFSWPDSVSELEYSLGEYQMILPNFSLIIRKPIVVNGIEGDFIKYSYQNESGTNGEGSQEPSELILGYEAYFDDAEMLWMINVRGVSTLEPKLEQTLNEICNSLKYEVYNNTQ
jgi:hypothetical protein